MIKTQFLLLSSILKTRLDEVHPNVFIVLRIMLNFLDTVASAERSFSKLKLIKTFNRSHMTDPHQPCCQSKLYVCFLDLDDVIKGFCMPKDSLK